MYDVVMYFSLEDLEDFMSIKKRDAYHVPFVCALGK